MLKCIRRNYYYENSHFKRWYDRRVRSVRSRTGADQVPETRQHPMWPMWEAVAPILAYDAAVIGDDFSVPTERAARIAVPVLIMDGGASYPFMHITAIALAKAIPHAQHRTLEGQTHEVVAEALAPLLIEFFKAY
jgi:pimeloyl-ACP methyl ester carboxylesterase